MGENPLAGTPLCPGPCASGVRAGVGFVNVEWLKERERQADRVAEGQRTARTAGALLWWITMRAFVEAVGERGACVTGAQFISMLEGTLDGAVAALADLGAGEKGGDGRVGEGEVQGRRAEEKELG